MSFKAMAEIQSRRLRVIVKAKGPKSQFARPLTDDRLYRVNSVTKSTRTGDWLANLGSSFVTEPERFQVIDRVAGHADW